MRWLSDPVDQLFSEERAHPHIVHDIIVVGSGYGGAVTALRQAQVGFGVLVLERGEEKLSGEFPNDINTLPGHVRAEVNGRKPVGLESAMFDFRLGDGVGALVGNALGGGSQINANVAIRPDPRIFAQGWPEAIKNDPQRDQWYAKAELALGVEPSANVSNVEPLKSKAVERLQSGLQETSGCKVAIEKPWLTVRFAKPARVGVAPPESVCNGCGDCVSGCNWNAKKTLTTSYLAEARAAGARLVTRAAVLSVKKVGELWEITVAHAQFRQELHESTPFSQGVDPRIQVLKARVVVLAAGALGSTEILLRSRTAGLGLSDKLGQELSCNGDYIAMSYQEDQQVNSIGAGSRTDFSKPQAAWNVRPVGPTITRSLKVENGLGPGRHALIQDGAIPGAIAGLFHELVTTLAVVNQLDKSTFRGEQVDTPEVDPLVLAASGLSHTQTLLVIGHDARQGSMSLDASSDRLALKWANKAASEYEKYDAWLSSVEHQGGIYLRNPAWTPLPSSLGNVLSGPEFGGMRFTVHPLGGCRMGNTIDEGVVDHEGSVFGQTGLFVLDGSIVPTSLGANPFLTITMLAERAQARVSSAIGTARNALQSSPGPYPVPELRTPYFNPQGSRVALNFSEVLRATQVDRLDERGKVDVSLLVHLPVRDLTAFFTHPDHEIEIDSAYGAGPDDLKACLRMDDVGAGIQRYFAVESGRVSILKRLKQRGWRLWLEYLRTALTWFFARGDEELLRSLKDRLSGRSAPTSPNQLGAGSLIRGWWRMVKHASEQRQFTYEIDLRDDQREAYFLSGTKTVEYATGWGALMRYAGRSLRFWLSLRKIKKPVLERRNLWVSLGALDATLWRVKRDTREKVFDATLKMDLIEITRRMAPQLAMARQTPEALVAAIGYATLFARLLLKTRLWDFRAADIPKHILPEFWKDSTPVEVPPHPGGPTPWPKQFPDLRLKNGRKIAPSTRISLFVQESDRNHDGKVELALVRYKQVLAHTEIEPGVLRAKSVILMNGFAMSTVGFVAQEMPQNLAEFYAEQGFDVWLFDYRTSTILDASKEPCTMDEIAAFDIPAAVDHVLKTLQRENSGLCATKTLQIHFYAHCVGGASLMMSVLAGKLKYDNGLNKLWGAAFSQMHALPVAGTSAQIRLPVAALIRDVLGWKTLPFAATDHTPDTLEALFDRIFSSLPFPEEEYCPHEGSPLSGDHPDVTTCKRISGYFSRIMVHSKVREETHRKFDLYWGRANLELFVHGAKCLEYERLVNKHGQNVYVTQENIVNNLNLPVALIHGTQNPLFEVESVRRTYDEFVRSQPHGLIKKIELDGYGHFDCTVGSDLERDDVLFGPLRKFVGEAWDHQPQTRPASEPSMRIKAPLAGPLVGWTRAEHGKFLSRLWIEVDETEADKALCGLTVLRAKDSAAPAVVKLWRIHREPYVSAFQNPAGTFAEVAICVCDIELDATDDGRYEVDFVSLHEYADGVCLGEDAINAIRKELPQTTGASKQNVCKLEPVEFTSETLGLDDVEALFSRLKESVRDTRTLALRANPGTLSRRRRALPMVNDWKVTLARRLRRAYTKDDGVRFLVGTCQYPGTQAEANRARASLDYAAELCGAPEANTDPVAMMLMVGDQIYADATAGIGDGMSAVEKIKYRYECAFNAPGFAQMAQWTPLVMAIDDHEIGDGWSADRLAILPGGAELLRAGLAGYCAFEHAHAPRSKNFAAADGFNSTFEVGGVAFAIVDTRSQRTLLGSVPSVLSVAQMDALKTWLTSAPQDSPKVIISGAVFAPLLEEDAFGGITADSWALAQDQRKDLLDFIDEEEIQRVLFISGDYHLDAFAEIAFRNGHKAHALVTPPLYAPLPFINAVTRNVVREEKIGNARIRSLGAGDGNGLLDVRLARGEKGQWVMTLITHWLRAEDAEPQFKSRTRTVVL